MDAGRQHRQHGRIVTGDDDELVVGQDVLVQKAEPAVFGGFDRHNIAIKTRQGRAKLAARLAEEPPAVPVGGAVVALPFGLHRLKQMLINQRMAPPHVGLVPPEQVDHLKISAAIRQITTIPIGADRRRRSDL